MLVDCPPTALTYVAEHSHYLDHLTAVALDEGATHVATVHPDSFPIRPGWAAALADHLRPDLPLVTSASPNSYCFLFTGEFHHAHAPRFKLTEAQRRSPLGQTLLAHPVRDHTGAGFLYPLVEQGLRWFALRTVRPASLRFPSAEIAGGTVAHLGGLLYHTGRSPASEHLPPRTPGALANLALAVRPALPKRLRERLKRHLPRAARQRLEHDRNAERRDEFAQAFETLCHDLDSFAARLQPYVTAVVEGESRALGQALS